MKKVFEKVGVVGSGQMGSGIAQVAATFGSEVLVYDVRPQSLEGARSAIEKSLAKLSEKQKITEPVETILKRLRFTANLSDLSSADLIIEAATENFEVKQKIFKDLDGLAKPSCVLASNTSSISITRLAATTQRPSLVIGMHFMNPVPLMKLVEVISGEMTSEETLSRIHAAVQSIDKVSTTSKDYPGFIVNRILMPMINEAIYALYEGIGSKEDIDQGMKLGTNQPMGPLELADFIGLDTCLSIMQVLHAGLGDSKYRPCPLLVNKVAAGLLGRKVGRGFYEYPKK